MSISIEKLSLPDSLAPLRSANTGTGAVPHTSFAEKFDKVLGGSEHASPGSTEQAVKLAESLSLQMLHRSLSLSGEAFHEENSVSSSIPYMTAKALRQAYQANPEPAGLPLQAHAEVSSPAQLQELSESVSPLKAAPAVHSKADPGWLEPIITKASRKYGVDSGLIKAVIKAESDFNPRAVSHAGARGLMQLMPATARSLGVADSFDPEQNVMGGTRFLKDMLQRYNGDVDSALAAYNWGPGNVDRKPDRLPRETRNYLARVKQLYDSYSA